MCEVNKFDANLDKLDDYLSFVNTDVDRLMRYEPTLYAAYLTLNPELQVELVKEWYREAEQRLVSAHSPDLYLAQKYDVLMNDTNIDALYEREVEEGALVECAGYWFAVDK